MGKGKFLKKQKVSAGKKIGRAFLVILLILLLLIGAVFAFIWSKLGLITYDDGTIKENSAYVDTAPTETEPQTDPIEETADVTDPITATDPEAVTGPAEEETEPEATIDMSGLTMETAPMYSSGDLLSDDDVTNILLVGSDEHTVGYLDSARGDVNILISINKRENTVKLVSFSRGIALKMMDGPYKGKYEWLTNVHRWAGTSAVLDAMEDAFKIEVDRYVRVNFNTVTRIINAVGGIDMELTAKEAKFINNLNSKKTQKNLVEGMNHLDGATATYYARLRGVDDDWYRMERQRKCILAVVDKLKGSSFSTLNDICDKILPRIKTNLTKMEIAELILYSPKFLEAEFDQMTIPIKNSYSGMTVMSGEGGWALNYDKNNAALHEFLYGVDAE